MGTFIEDAIKNKDKDNHEYEDAVVQGQIIDAKDIIKQAIMRNKNSATWYYTPGDSYSGAYISIVSDVNPEYSDKNPNIFVDYKTNSVSAGEYNLSRGVCAYLVARVYHRRVGGPDIPPSLDYAYVKRKVEKELWNLGCKQVEVLIGPITYIGQGILSSKKSFLTGKYKYKYYDKEMTAIKWMISISW